MDPQQELFTELLLRLKEKGYDVYDTFLPPEGTPYPFIYLADSQQTDDSNKTAIFGNVYQTIITIPGSEVQCQGFCWI